MRSVRKMTFLHENCEKVPNSYSILLLIQYRDFLKYETIRKYVLIGFWYHAKIKSNKNQLMATFWKNSKAPIFAYLIPLRTSILSQIRPFHFCTPEVTKGESKLLNVKIQDVHLDSYEYRFVLHNSPRSFYKNLSSIVTKVCSRTSKSLKHFESFCGVM